MHCSNILISATELNDNSLKEKETWINRIATRT
jgi:hypothetical protein